jgi:cell division control protein 45
MVLVDKKLFAEEFESISDTCLTGNVSGVLVFVAPDCDALCSCKILTSLLKSKHIGSFIRPVSGYDDLRDANEQLVKGKTDLRVIVLINCGGIVDLDKFFDLEESCVVYVLDAHRPYHLGNVAESNVQVRVLDDGDKPFNEENYPMEAHDGLELFRVNGDLSSDEDDSDDDDGGYRGQSPSKRRRGNNYDDDLENRRIRRAFRETIEDYYRGFSYGMSSSTLAYDMAVQLGKGDNELLWLAIVGSTEQLVHNVNQKEQYERQVIYFREEVRGLNADLDELKNEGTGNSLGDQLTRATRMENDELVASVQRGHISYNSDEYRFMLLRHWNLYDAMYHSPYVAARFGIWKEHGKRKLKGLLSKTGVRLDDCKQPFVFMSESSQRTLDEKLVDNANNQGLTEITFPCFVKQHNSNLQLSSADMVYAVTALLEDTKESSEVSEKEEDPSENSRSFWEVHFWNAYAALSNANDCLDTINRGLEQSKMTQEKIVEQGIAMIRSKDLISGGPFRYAFVQEESPNLKLFSKPIILSKLALFIVDSLMEIVKKKPKPFVICSLIPECKRYLVVGTTGDGLTTKIPGSTTNTFGCAFREAAMRTNARIKHDGFNTCWLEVQMDDVNDFMKYLHSGLIKL